MYVRSCNFGSLLYLTKSIAVFPNLFSMSHFYFQNRTTQYDSLDDHTATIAIFFVVNTKKETEEEKGHLFKYGAQLLQRVVIIHETAT